MRRLLLAGLVLLALLFSGGPALGEGSFVVDDDYDVLPPDARRQAWALMQLMTREEKIYQLFFVTPEDLTGEAHCTALGEANVFAQRPVGGVMIYGQNIAGEEQLRGLIGALKAQASSAGVNQLFIGVNEEGGLVSRVANKLGYPLEASPGEIGAAGDAEAAYEVGRRISAYLTPFGFNLCFAPPVDTVVNEEPGAQTYGGEAELVSRMGMAMAQGLREGGMIPCFTHFPGHGSMDGTTAKVLSIRRTLQELRALEFVPFQNAVDSGAEMLLVSHGWVRSVGDEIPASVSNIMINGLLRGEWGYDGVIVTDSLRMAPITSAYKAGKESVAALKAGADILLLPPDLNAAVQAIDKALESGELTMARIEESVARILEVKIKMKLITE